MIKTAEAVSLGHPDKTADYISSYILDRLIEQDKNVRYAVEVMIKDNIVVLGGEVKGNVSLAKVNEYVLKALEEIDIVPEHAPQPSAREAHAGHGRLQLIGHGILVFHA